MRDLNTLPENLPVPQDDGACRHLEGMKLPSLSLPSTSGRLINLQAAAVGPTAFFFYPRTGRPEKAPPPSWDLIPGARGCTPQSCGYRDRHQDFAKLGITVFGVSAQSTDYQKEFVVRNHMPFEFLSDERFLLTAALRLPTFEFESTTLIKRLSFIATGSRIVRVFYPVFPPDRNAGEMLEWLSEHPLS